MSNVLSRRGLLAAALASLAVPQFQANAAEKTPEKLTLKSGYSGKILIAGARRVYLSVTLDEKRGGSGSLTLDPNVTEGNTSTLIAVHATPVELRLLQEEGQAAKGRRLYELQKTGAEGKGEAGGDRWFLAVPLKKGAPSWLILADKDGKFQDVLALE